MTRTKPQPETTERKTKRPQKATAEVQTYEIHKLLDYPAVRNLGSTAKVEFLGEFTPGANIEDEIDQRFGAGWYRVCERLASGKLGHSWAVRGRDVSEPETIEDDESESDEPGVERERVVHHHHDAASVRDVAELAARRAVEQYKAEGAPATTAPNGFDDFLKAIERFETFKSKVIGSQPAPVQSNPVPATAEKSLEDRLLETVLVKALESGNDSTLDKVLEMLRPSKEPTLMDGIADILKPLVPMVIPLLNGFIANGMNAAKPQPTTPPTVLRSHPVPQTAPTAPAAAPSTAPPSQELPMSEPTAQPVIDDPAQRAWVRLAKRMCEDCYDDASVLPSVEGIIDLVDRFNQFGPIVGQLISATPSDLLGMLAMQFPEYQGLQSLPHAVEWIQDLQKQTTTTISEMEDGPEAAGAQTGTTTVDSTAQMGAATAQDVQ